MTIESIEAIGTWAGQVYKALEATDTRMLGLKQLKKATKLKNDQISAALGWLGREGKIVISMNDEETVTTLV
ncbi:MAG: winged helix-turn-helix domain-containing protein [Muribaculaceae bacterium]|nr:winged helix-turn-helix domain-containing protein [Muribaculaceae bacterium]MDE6754999.1 winged helix-turn-helix domain-containing protein [Muribaculaceae bacterium]